MRETEARLLVQRSEDAALPMERAKLVGEGRRLVPWRHPEVHAALSRKVGTVGQTVAQNLDWGKPTWQPKVSWAWALAPPAFSSATGVAVHAAQHTQLIWPPRERSAKGRYIK